MKTSTVELFMGYTGLLEFGIIAEGVMPAADATLVFDGE